MGVIDKVPGYGEDGLYSFSSRPLTPRDKAGNLLVKFQAVSRTHQKQSYHYVRVNSKDRLSHVRRNINIQFKDYFERGFIFLSKTREVLRSDERKTTIFDILPKIPVAKPSESFRYPDVEYKRVSHTYDGRRYIVMCACVVFLYERSKVSHWPSHELHQQLCENLLEGFSFIPTDIMSWKPKLIELQATLLHINAACGNVKDLEDAIQKLPFTPNVYDICDERNATPLHYAAENGKLDACEILINGIGRDQIFVKDMHGRSPLHCALYRRRRDVIIYLLQLNSEVMDMDNKGISCIDLLLRQYDIDISYIASSLEISCLDKHLQFHLAYIMLYLKQEEHCERILQMLPDFETFDFSLIQRDCSLLHLSSKLNSNLTKILIQKNFPKLERDIEGNLPFHIACQNGHIQQIRLLFDDQISEKDLNKGIKVALRNNKFESCLVIDEIKITSVLYETTVCMIMESLNKLLGVLRKNPKKQKFVETVAGKLLPLLKEQKGSAEQYVFDAAFYGLDKTLSLLQSLGITFDLSDEMRRTPLHEACQRNHKQCVQLLLKGGARPNTTDWRGGTPLHYACEKGNDAIVQILIDSHKDIGLNLQDGSGKTPLMTAMVNRQHRVVRLLLQSCSIKCNVNAVDTLGHTVLHYLTMVDDDLEDILIQLYKQEKLAATNSEGKRSKEINMQNRTRIVWKETEKVTFFRGFNFVDPLLLMGDKIPFLYADIELPWNEFRAGVIFPEKLPMSPSKKYEVCKNCTNLIKSKKRHICADNKSESETYLKEIRAFEFHQKTDPSFSCLLQNALKAGKITTFKKLVKHFPFLLKDVDASRRNILDFAVQQHSLKAIKTVRDILKPNADYLHHIIMFAANGKSIAMQNVLETFIQPGIQASFIPEPTNFFHICEKKNFKTSSTCNCFLKSYTILEAAVITKIKSIFYALLERTKDDNFGIALHLAVYFGLPEFVDAILKKNTRREISRDIQAIEKAYILDLACRSPHITDKVFEVLLMHQPDFVDSQEMFSCDDLSELRPDIWSTVSLLHFKEKTPLAKLFSNEHLTNQKSRQKILDKAGCLLIRSGVHLGSFKSTNEEKGTSSCIHGICEALRPALQSGHFESALLMIRKEGHVLWHCALTKHKCDVQKQFRAVTLLQKKNVREIPIEYIKYILTYSCQKQVPEVILQNLIQSGKEVEGIDTADVSVKEFEINHRLFAIAECKTLLEKVARCVIEIVTQGIFSEFAQIDLLKWPRAKSQKMDLLRLIKCVPGSINCFSNFNFRALSPLIVKMAAQSLLRDCTVMLNRSGQPDCISFPSGTSLLHLACSTTNLEFVKLILKAPLPVNINAKTKNGVRPIDIAVIYGSWDIYKFLVDNGATFTAKTYIACCSDDRYESINSWTKRIRSLCFCEKPSSKTKKRILIDLYERKKIDWNCCIEDRGSPLYNAIDNHLDDIIIYLVDTDPTLLVSALDYNVNVIARMQLCNESTLGHVYNIMSSQISRFKMKTLGQLLLQTTIGKRKNLTEILIRAFHRVIERKQLEIVLQEKDNHGKNVFHFVAIYGWETIARQLVQVAHVESKSNFSLNVTDLAGASPLWYALAFKHWKLAKIYLLASANAILPRAVPGCFMKKSKPPDINDIVFKECEQYNVLTSVRGIKMSSRRKFSSSKDADNFISGENITSSSKTVYGKENQQKHMSPSIDRDKKRVEYLLKKAYMSQMYGYSLIHFASRTGDLKLLEEILSISDEKHKYGDVLSQGHRLSFIGNQTAICDVYQKYGVIREDDDVFHSIVWHVLRNEDIQSNVYRFLFCMLGFVHDNSIKTSETSIQRFECVPNYRGFSYKTEKDLFMKYLERLCEALSDQGEDQKLIAELKMKLSYIYKRVRANSMERKNFETLEIYSQSFDTSSVESTMTTFLQSIDGKSKIDEKDILLLLSMNQTWIIQSILEVSKTNKFVAKLLRRQLLWNLNMLDCIIIALPDDHGRTERVSLFQQNICQSIMILVDVLNLSPQEMTIRLASKKCLWIFLMGVATLVIPKERELKVSWQISLAQAARSGQLDFVKSILDNISIPKLPEPIQASFAALLCCSAFYGQTDIVKYLFRKSVPIKFDKENLLFIDLLGDIYAKNYDVLEYAIKSKQPETVDAVIKFCKYDKEFMKCTKPVDYFELAANQGIWQIMKNFLDLFGNNELPSKSSWEKFFIKAAERGQEDFCAKLLEEGKAIDVLTVDKSNKNVLHYCGIHNLKNVTRLVLEKSSMGVDSSDSDGMRPMDYAVDLGNITVLDLLMKAKPLYLKQKVDSVEAYGWFRFYMNKVNLEEAEIHKVSIRPALPKARTLELSNLYQRGEDDAAATLIFCSKHIQTLLLENPKQYGFILHDSIKYGCKKSFHAIMTYFGGDDDKIRRVLKHEFKGLTSLAAAVCFTQLTIAEYIFKYDDGMTWTMKKSAKNLLHLAVYTQDPKIIELVGSKTCGKLCGMKDSCGLTPEVYLCSLGLQNHYSCLKTDAILDPWVDSHVEHIDSDPDVTCLNCLLNGCIGWSKIYNGTLKTNQLQQIRSTKNALPPNILVEWFWKLGKSRKESLIITSILISSGFDSTYLTLLKLVARKEGIEKMITVEGIEETLNEFEKSPNILENILAMSVVSNSEVIFVALLDHAGNLNRQMKKSYGISLFEAIVGLSRLQLLEHLKTKIMSEDDDFSTFKELHSVLPQKPLWVSGLDQLGGNQWPYFDVTVNGHTPLILKSDLWMIQSSTIPESIRKEMEARSVKESIILSEFTELKYNVDFESFRKNPHFAKLTDMWINCFLMSSVVLCHIEEIKNSQEAKFSSAKSVKVVCLTSGTTDHPKVTIDNNGALLNQIRVSIDKGSTFVRQDRSFCQRPKEIHLREDLQERVIPYFEDFIKKEFGLQIKVKVDWNAIELRKRTYNTEVILKSLNGELYGNMLGGLEDVLNECRDLKDDIESMFNKDTTMIAMRDFINITEIIVSFDDKISSQQVSYKSGQHVIGETVWKFTVTQSQLLYDRSQFPLWQHLTLYRAICVSACHSVYCISRIDGLKKREPETKKDSPQPITFEVDSHSFGISDTSTLRTLLCQNVSRELVAIAYDCESMLRLKMSSKKVVLKSTISLQHTGVTFQENVATVHICCNETDSKEWFVERSNTLFKLADFEDKQLLLEWAGEDLKQMNEIAINVQKNITEKAGIVINFQFDEKRVLLPCFSKFRREMNHPLDLLKRSLTTCYNVYGDIYIQILEDIFLSQKNPAMKLNRVDNCASGVWINLRKEKLKTGMLVLFKTLARQYIVTGFELPCQNKFPILENEIFENVSESKEVKDYNIAWKHEIITENNQSQLRPDLVSMNGNIFSFSDEKLLQKKVQGLCLRVIISQDTALALDCGYHDLIHKKVLDHSGIIMSESSLRDTFLIHYWAKKEIQTLLNIDSVDINWDSFVQHDDTSLMQNFSNCLHALVDSFHEVFPSIPECIVTQRIVNEMYTLFSGISSIRIAMSDDPNLHNADEIGRQLRDDEKKPNLVIRILERDILEIFFIRQRKISKFPDLLYRAGVELAEMNIKSLLGLKNRKSYLNNNQEETKKQVSKTIIRPSYDEVMLHLSNIRFSLVSVSGCIKSFKTIVPDEVEEFYFVKSLKKTGFVIKSKTLLYSISKKDVDPRELADQLLEEFQFQSLEKTLVILDLGVSEPVAFEKDSPTLEVALDVNDYNIKAENIDKTKITNPEEYKISLQGEEETLKVVKVERREERLVLTLQTNVNAQLKDKQYIVVHHKYIRPENSKTLLFGGLAMKALKPCYSLEVCEEIKMKRTEALKILLEHGTMSMGNRYQPVSNRNEAICEQDFLTRKVKFTFNYQRKHFPSSDPTTPFTLAGISSRPMCQLYSLKITDSERYFRLRAQCLCCKRYLDVITRFGRIRAGRDLCVNYPET